MFDEALGLTTQDGAQMPPWPGFTVIHSHVGSRRSRKVDSCAKAWDQSG